MTWQRIDEDTYIDDTLVTCAEYQLFIDEMREHGKYYQPDHWRTYQFPEGKSQTPILGVRSLDAVAFCAWLIQNATSELQYRIPTFAEADQFAFKQSTQSLIGCWTKKENTNYLLSWNKEYPINPRGIDGNKIIEFVLGIYEKYYDHEIFAAEDTERILKDILDDYIARTRELDISQIGKLVSVMDNVLDKDEDVDEPISRSVKVIEERDWEITQADKHLLIILKLCSRRIPRFSRFADYQRQPILLLIDSYTLQERIAGRSPAFEGIRLVKERIR